MGFSTPSDLCHEVWVLLRDTCLNPPPAPIARTSGPAVWAPLIRARVGKTRPVHTLNVFWCCCRPLPRGCVEYQNMTVLSSPKVFVRMGGLERSNRRRKAWSGSDGINKKSSARWICYMSSCGPPSSPAAGRAAATQAFWQQEQQRHEVSLATQQPGANLAAAGFFKRQPSWSH